MKNEAALLPGDYCIAIEVHSHGCEPWSVTAKANLILGPVATARRRPAQFSITWKTRVSHVIHIGSCDNGLGPQRGFDTQHAAAGYTSHDRRGIPLVACLSVNKTCPRLTKLSL